MMSEGTTGALIMVYTLGLLASATTFMYETNPAKRSSFAALLATTLFWPFWFLRSLVRGLIEVWKS